MKSNKRFRVIISVILLVVFLTACSGGASGTPATPAPASSSDAAGSATGASDANNSDSGEQLHIGFIIKNEAQDAYMTNMGIAAVQEAEKAGVKLTKLDSKGDLTLQLSQIQNLIQMNVDLIVLFPDNGTTVIPTLKTAHEAGIPVVLVTTIIDEEGFPYVNAYAGANNIEEGEIAGKLTVEAASKAGFTKENPAKMVELTGPAGNVMSMLRSQGWHNYVDEAENIEVLDTQPADYNMEKSQQFVENWIIKHPDLWGVYAAGSGMSLGTCAAIKNAGKTGEIKVFTLSVLKAGYDLFLEGAMDGGSILSPYRDAEMAFDVAMKILNGEDYDFYNYTVVQEITPENVETLERPTW